MRLIQTALGIVLSTATNNKLAGVVWLEGWEAMTRLKTNSRTLDIAGFDTLRVKFKPDVT